MCAVPTAAANSGSCEMWSDKALAELSEADRAACGADSVAWRGTVFAVVAVVKGECGPAEAAGGAALSGQDGDAVDKALSALGFEPGTIFYTLSRPEQDMEPAIRSARLRAHVEAVDPDVVIALDGKAAEDLAAAFGLAGLKYGSPHACMGRTFVAVDGFEASLSDAARKRRVWNQMKHARPLGPAY